MGRPRKNRDIEVPLIEEKPQAEEIKEDIKPVFDKVFFIPVKNRKTGMYYVGRIHYNEFGELSTVIERETPDDYGLPIKERAYILNVQHGVF